ncbi:integrase/recombinase XerD [Pararhizobium capsulatum DSM 1112]|uniref:Integrase/recombinase XerD n=1 Tax=Pararhizobium capsulatum DSM 1112 TaxID=1121113 RepID=A0ABU0C0H3_9HYPH|nr:site-specific integrase [Pararhizobium capsulatum]MDQ0324028.1 integrase/recombinase XerD [Pararhizobium capsulatum DSM 1112]
MATKFPPRSEWAKYNKKTPKRRATHRGPLGKAKVLTPEQFDMAAERAPIDNVFGTRDRLFVLLSRFCGLRAREIATLHVHDVTDATGELLDHISVSKRGAKYGKERTVRMRPELIEALRDYLEQTAITDGPIFWSQRGIPASSNLVQKQLKRLYTICGFKGARSHSGRRYAITTMAQHANTVGASLEDVRIFAGHSRITTTGSYIEESPFAAKMINFL